MASAPDPAPDSLAEALRENQQLRKSLAELQAEMQRLIYAVSHDLQEPLRAVISYAQLLDRQFATADPAAREYSAFVLEGANRMKDLLQQLLLYVRAGSSRHRSAISLNLPLRRALLKLAPDIAACSAHIEQGSLPKAFADEGEIAQVFQNILGNALKFRSAETPEIAVSAEQGTEECTVTVRDNGPGIDPRYCEQVLLPFKRLHGKEVPGTGLGLAICDKIVHAHHGRLWIESDGSNGSSVRFTLPA